MSNIIYLFFIQFYLFSNTWD